MTRYAPVVVRGIDPPKIPQRCLIIKDFDPNKPVKEKKPLLPWKRRELKRVVDMVEAMPGAHRCAVFLYLTEMKWSMVGRYAFYTDLPSEE